MARILLPRRNNPEIDPASVRMLYASIESALRPHHDVVLIPVDEIWPRWEVKQWFSTQGLNSDIYITNIANSTDAVPILRSAGWNGGVLFLALGSFPRGAARLRGSIEFLRRTDIVWCSCTADKKIYECLVEQDGYEPRVVVLPYGIDTETFRPFDDELRERCREQLGIVPDEFVMVYCGRVTLEKNVYALLEVLAELIRRRNRARLIIAGTVEDVVFNELGMDKTGLADIINNRIRKLNLSDHVQWLDWLDHSNLVKVLNAADVLANLTLHHDENFGFIQAEAASVGLPVVGTAWGGLKDTVIDGETGFLVDTWVTDYGIRYDMPRVIAAIEKLIQRSDLRQTMRIRARKHAVEEFSLTTMNDKLLRLIQMLVSEKPPSYRSPRLSSFGRRYHERFSEVLPDTGEKIAVEPRYNGMSDPDYIHMIQHYTSCPTPMEIKDEDCLFLALPGRITGSYFVSDDLLWEVRFKLTPKEREVLANLNRFDGVPRRLLNCEDEVLRALVRKGLVGLTREIWGNKNN